MQNEIPLPHHLAVQCHWGEKNEDQSNQSQQISANSLTAQHCCCFLWLSSAASKPHPWQHRLIKISVTNTATTLAVPNCTPATATAGAKGAWVLHPKINSAEETLETCLLCGTAGLGWVQVTCTNLKLPKAADRVVSGIISRHKLWGSGTGATKGF